jgi:hypothetical protein
MLLTSTPGEVIEVMVTFGLIVVVMAVMLAIPFAVEYYVDDRREPEE